MEIRRNGNLGSNFLQKGSKWNSILSRMDCMLAWGWRDLAGGFPGATVPGGLVAGDRIFLGVCSKQTEFGRNR